MNRNVKAIGATLLAALTMCAITASAASAESFAFYSEIEHTTLTGSNAGTHEFTVDAGTATCKTVQYSGTVTSKESTEIAITPKYESCTADPLGTVDVAVNGCQYVLVPITKEGSTYKAEMSLACGEGQSITVLVTISGVTKCTIDIPPQTLGPVTLTEVSEGDVEVNAVLEGIEYDQTAGTGLGACASGENTTNGIYKGTSAIAGSLAEAQPNIGMQKPKLILLSSTPVKFTGKNNEQTITIYNESGANLTGAIKHKVAGGASDYELTQDGCNKGIAKGGSCQIKLKCKTAGATDGYYIPETTTPPDPHGTSSSKLEGC